MKTREKCRRRAAWFGVVAAGLVTYALSWVIQARAAEQAASGPPPTPPPPNIIFILADDFSMNLVEHMQSSGYPHGLQEMTSQGTTFTNYFVSNSLCCPSRSSIFTGKYPHNTKVFGNTWAPNATPPVMDGGFGAFQHYQNEQHTFALALQKGKYKTAMFGKYLNGYQPGVPTPYTTWRWDEWYVAGDGYPEFNYVLNQNGVPQNYGIDASDYLTDNISNLAQTFIEAHAKGPFFIEIATFAPHAPYRPAYRDETKFPGLKLSRGGAYGQSPTPTTAPDWMKDAPHDNHDQQCNKH